MSEMIDPRVSAMFRTQPKPIQFLAAAMCALLGAKKTAALVDAFAPRDVDWRQVVAGKPLHYFNGKNAAALADEGFAPEQIQEVRDAYTARDMEFPETDAPADPDAATAPETPPAAPLVGGKQGTVAVPGSGNAPRPPGDLGGALTRPDDPAGGGPDAPPGDGEGDSGEPDGGTPENPTVAGYRLSELAGKTDEQLLGMQGIGRATLTRIRQMEAERAAK
jgi:hypothetical protein